MSDGAGRKHVAIRRLTIAGLAIVVLMTAGAIWSAGREIRQLRENAYPIPGTQCQHGKDCEQRALQIEAREAITADNALDVAVGQLALSILGIAGVGLTIYYAHLAFIEAQRSAEATILASETSDKTLRITQRAYIVIRELVRGVATHASPEGIHRCLTLVVKFNNSGATIAKNAKVTAEWKFQRVGEPLEFTAGDAITDNISRGGERETIMHHIPFNLVEATYLGRAEIFFRAQVEYFDLFDPADLRLARTTWQLEILSV